MNTILPLTLDNKPSSVFRVYMAAVLLQFAILSLCSVRLVEYSDMLFDVNFWCGIFSGFGACSLAFKSHFKHWRAGAICSEIAAVATFIVLSYDYLTRKPPIVAGSVLSATAAVFLIGGLIHERRTA